MAPTPEQLADYAGAKDDLGALWADIQALGLSPLEVIILTLLYISRRSDRANGP